MVWDVTIVTSDLHGLGCNDRHNAKHAIAKHANAKHAIAEHAIAKKGRWKMVDCPPVECNKLPWLMNDHAIHQQKPMLVKNLLCSLAVVGLLAGCARSLPPVSTYYDMSGLRTDLLEGNRLPSPVNPPREIVWLNASRLYKTPTDSVYYLEVEYMAKEETGLLDIPYGETLTLVLDGKPVKFKSNGSMNLRKASSEGIVRERALYSVTREQLQQIAAAKKVEVQIKGNNGLVVREFDAENYRRFRLFVITYAG